MDSRQHDSFSGALQSDDTEVVLRELQAGRSPLERFHFGRTPLHVAAAAGSNACIRMLLERGASLEAHDEAGHSPLIEALGSGQVESAALLIRLGALLSYRFTRDDSPAAREEQRRMFEHTTKAAREAHPDIYRLIEDNMSGPENDAFQRQMLDSLVTLCFSPQDIHAIHHCQSLESLRLIGEQPGIGLNIHDGGGYWPLKSFAETGDVSAVGWLLRHGAEPDFTSTGDTALHAAVGGDHLECARLLLDAGADPNQQDVDGCVPMWRVSSDAMLDLLLAHGADPTIGDQCDYRPSHWVKDPALKSRLHALERK